MIAELGHFTLTLALAFALAQATFGFAGAAKGRIDWMGASRSAAFMQFILIAVAFGALTHAYVTSDFSVKNVVENSNSLKPLIYKISGVWGNHEGSMVLWVLVLALLGSAVALFGNNLPPSLRSRVLAVQALIGIGFLLFILLTSNPFERVFPAPLDGRDLNPLLALRVRSVAMIDPPLAVVVGDWVSDTLLKQLSFTPCNSPESMQ